MTQAAAIRRTGEIKQARFTKVNWIQTVAALSALRLSAPAPQLARKRFVRTLQWWLLRCAGLSVITTIAFRLQWGLATASFCYLVLVVFHSLVGDFFATAALCLLAVGCLDYFFVPPILSLQIASPLNGLALVSFLLTALITRLVVQIREKTVSSEMQHENLKRLYDLAQQLLELEPEIAVGTKFLEPFLGVFGVRSVCLFDGITPELHQAGYAHDVLQIETREAFLRRQDKDDSERMVAIRCIRVGGQTTGAIGFEGLQDCTVTAGPLSALAAALLERMHAFRKASSAAAAAQTEAYRSVILDALAHEFKTPLSTILAASGALREAGSLGPEHMEMAETVENEAARLGRLTSRLIRTARLEREEVKPWRELIDVSSVVADTVEQYSKLSVNRRISVVKRCASSDVLADPELLRLALSQLLDNACKYSPTGTPVEFAVGREHGHITVRVLSKGASIPAVDTAHIFKRFYRGADAGNVPGTGLGLYVARKIALAHGGNLELEDGEEEAQVTAFRLSIPMAESERNNA